MTDVRMANDLVLLGTITIFDEGLADVIQGSGRPSTDCHSSGADGVAHRNRRAGKLAKQMRTLFPRYQDDQRLGNLCQRRTVGPAKWGRYCPPGGSHLPDQPRFRNRRWAGRGAHPGLGDRPSSRWRTARRHRDHQQQPKASSFQPGVAMRADFADIFEVKGDNIVRRGHIITSWLAKRETLRMTYRNKDFCREVIVRTGEGDGRPTVYANGRLSFDIALKPGQAWHRCLVYDLVDGSKRFRASKECIHSSATSDHSRNIDEWQRTVLKIETSNEEFYRCYNQGVQDMAALRLPLQGMDHMVFVPAAGLPWFVALFGRDTLIVSLQTMIVYPEFAAGTLEVLAQYQARERDDYRDAEPGKILHELRYGELAHFKLIPHTPYYGTADATPLYLIALHSAWQATGDRTLIERHLPNAEACLTWIDKYGDRDGDGFQEYQTRSTAGYENMAWKDSGDAVMYPDGSLVRGPKALCELQGYVYDAWLRMAEIYDELGNTRRANVLRKKAAALFEKFNEDFWDEQSGFYAFALDGDKKKVLSAASNVGQCLWSGIIAPERRPRSEAAD